MTSQSPLIQTASAAALACLVASMGFFALGRTNVPMAQKSLMDGTYQRLYEHQFDRNLPLRSLSVNLWNALLFNLLGQTRDGAVLANDGWLFTAEEFRPPADPVDFLAEVQYAQTVLSTQNIPVFVIIVPDKARIYNHKLDRPRSDHFVNRYQLVLNALGRQSTETVDLRPVLAPSAKAAPTYMRTDTHWSPDGARLVANSVAERLTTTDILRSAFQTDPLGNTPFDGDLLSFVDTGVLRARFGPATEFIDQFHTQNLSHNTLFGDTAPPVALVGTSYSARPEFHFVGFLKQALGADVVSYAREGHGPFAPMRDFLASRDLQENPPQLVLWEIPERYISPGEIQ